MTAGDKRDQSSSIPWDRCGERFETGITLHMRLLSSGPVRHFRTLQQIIAKFGAALNERITEKHAKAWGEGRWERAAESWRVARKQIYAVIVYGERNTRRNNLRLLRANC